MPLDFIRKAIQEIYSSSNVENYPVSITDKTKVKLKLNELIESQWVSYHSSVIKDFEASLGNVISKPGCVVCTGSGTTALTVYCRHIFREHLESEILCTSLTFAASASSIVSAGLVPHFVDVERASFGICASSLAKYIEKFLVYKQGCLINPTTGRKIAGLQLVHLFGFRPIHYDQLISIAKKYNLIVYEDCAEALGSFCGGRHAGAGEYGSVLSFNANKIITTGAGGAIIARDKSEAEHLFRLIRTAKVQCNEIDSDFLPGGSNDAISAYAACIGNVQLESLSVILKKKSQIHQKYKKLLRNEEKISLVSPEYEGECKPNYWLNACTIAFSSMDERTDFFASAANTGICGIRPMWPPLYNLTAFKTFPKAPTPICDDIWWKLILLPSGPNHT